jgi:hypothetical protein
METFDGVEKSGRSSGADQSGDDLAAHQTGLSDPGDDHPPFAGQDDLDGPDETFIDPVEKPLHRFGFDANDFFGVAQDFFQGPNLDELVKSRKSIEFVIPAKAGIPLFQDVLDPGFRRGDAPRDFLRDHQP